MRQRPLEHRVHAVEQIADPASLGFEHHDLHVRKPLEHPVVEQRDERLLHALGHEHVEIPTEVDGLGRDEFVEARQMRKPDRLERRVQRNRDVEVLGGRPHLVVVRVSVGFARPRKRGEERALAAVLDGAAEFLGGFRGIAARQMGDRDEPAAGIRAEVDDPAVVGAAVRRGQGRVLDFAFPQQPDRGIQNDLGQPLAVDAPNTFLGIHGAERRAGQIRPFRAGLDVGMSHRAQNAGEPLLAQLGRPVVELEILPALVVLPDPNGPVAVLGFEILLPQVRDLQNVAVTIDGAFEADRSVPLRHDALLMVWGLCVASV